ncbi:MAG: siderophore-interacting protein [Pseudomonadota bacterium]
MSQTKTYSLSATTRLPGVQFSTLRTLSLREAVEHELDVLIDVPGALKINTIYGAYEFEECDGETIATVHSDVMNSLFILKDALVQNLEQFAPKAAAQVQWSDGDGEGNYPPNFQFTTVEAIERISDRFLRLRLLGSDLTAYTDEAIHFRFVLPALGATEIEWPSVRANGSILWPEGDKSLHRPVYTARSVSTDARTLEVDIFLHDGGRVTEWAKNLAVNEQVAIIGPGGGGIPKAETIHLFADETGYPAAARILEALPSETKGTLTLLTERDGKNDYIFDTPSAVSISWIGRNQTAAFDARARDVIAKLDDAYFWYAGERNSVSAIRSVATEAGVSKQNRYIAVYWSRG